MENKRNVVENKELDRLLMKIPGFETFNKRTMLLGLWETRVNGRGG